MQPGVISWQGSVLLWEQANSPQWSFSDRVVCVRTWRGPYAAALAASVLKGTIGTGPQIGMLVAESNVTREKAGIANLTVRYEGPAQGTLRPPEAEILGERGESPVENNVRDK